MVLSQKTYSHSLLFYVYVYVTLSEFLVLSLRSTQFPFETKSRKETCVIEKAMVYTLRKKKKKQAETNEQNIYDHTLSC